MISDGYNVESQRLMILMLSPQSATFDSQKRWFVYITIYIYTYTIYTYIHIYIYIHIYTYLYMFTPSMSPRKVFEMFAETGRELSTSTGLVSRPCQRLAWLGLACCPTPISKHWALGKRNFNEILNGTQISSYFQYFQLFPVYFQSFSWFSMWFPAFFQWSSVPSSGLSISTSPADSSRPCIRPLGAGPCQSRSQLFHEATIQLLGYRHLKNPPYIHTYIYTHIHT